jgi:hypothetical protein
MFNVIEKFLHNILPINFLKNDRKSGTEDPSDPLIGFLTGKYEIKWYEDIFEMAPALYVCAILLGSVFYMFANSKFRCYLIHFP